MTETVASGESPSSSRKVEIAHKKSTREKLIKNFIRRVSQFFDLVKILFLAIIWSKVVLLSLKFTLYVAIGFVIAAFFFIYSSDSLKGLTSYDKLMMAQNAFIEEKHEIKNYTFRKGENKFIYYSKRQGINFYIEDKNNFIGYFSISVFLIGLFISSVQLTRKCSLQNLFAYVLSLLGFGLFSAAYIISPPALSPLVHTISHEIHSMKSNTTAIFEEGMYKLNNHGKDEVEKIINRFNKNNSYYNSIMVEGLADGVMISDCQILQSLSLTQFEETAMSLAFNYNKIPDKKCEYKPDDTVRSKFKIRPLVDLDLLLKEASGDPKIDNLSFYKSNIELAYLRAYSIMNYIKKEHDDKIGDTPIYISSSSCAKSEHGTDFKLCNSKSNSKNRVVNIIFYHDKNLPIKKQN